MFPYTHRIISHHVQSNIKEQLNYQLDSKNFAWGNMKPDMVPSLAVKKHYKTESFDFVIDKIMDLMKHQPQELLDKNKKKKIEGEIGVICHFVSDYFCIPHNQRWEFKHSMVPHVKYETRLDSKASQYNVIDSISLPTLKNYSRRNVILFLEELLEEYETKRDYKRDIIYSVNICTRISGMILGAILSKDKKNKGIVFTK